MKTVAWVCIENGRIHRDSAWLRLKLRFWRRPAARWEWPHRVCRHYLPLRGPRQ